MGEAEIQSAVEAAAVIFKKVVLQRRQAAKKANEEGKLISTILFSLTKSNAIEWNKIKGNNWNVWYLIVRNFELKRKIRRCFVFFVQKC